MGTAIPQKLLYLLALLLFVVVQTGRGYRNYLSSASGLDVGLDAIFSMATSENVTRIVLQAAQDATDMILGENPTPQTAAATTDPTTLITTTTLQTRASSKSTGQRSTSRSGSPDSVSRTRTSLILPTDNNHMAGCLLVMDENFRLTEWLAYHYHVLPLQRLIVAVDPNSQSFPDEILEIFRSELGMNLTRWDDGDYGDWEALTIKTPASVAEAGVVRDRHRRRQSTFMQKCMHHLAKEGWTWTALWDTDEFLTYNRFGHHRIGLKTNKTIHAPKDLTEPGNAMMFLQAYGEEACVPIYRVSISANESLTASKIEKEESHIVHYKRLDTIRYRYRNKYDDKLNGNGKCLVNVQKVNYNATVRSVHRPAMNICHPAAWGLTKNYPFLIHHFIGSWEAFSWREDARKGWDRTYEKWLYRSEASAAVYDESTVSWLQGFVKNVGAGKAKRILSNAGLPPDYDATDKIQEFRCRIGRSCKRLHDMGYNTPPLQSAIPHNESEVAREELPAALDEVAEELPVAPNGGMAACLLTMDDNYRMYEWLSYHYHVLPLRRVIVAVDPASQTSPEPVFDLFRKELNMSITTWTDSDFVAWEPLDPNASQSEKRQRYLDRQMRFLEGCMHQLAKENRKMTALWDTDEYIRFNGYNATIQHPVTKVKVVTPPDLVEHGSVLKFLQRYGEETCVPTYRVLVGSRETSLETMQKEDYAPFDYRRLDTLRFRYRNQYDDKLNGNGKALLNVQKTNPNETVRTPHRPAMTICQAAAWSVTRNNPFMIQHYLGSWEAYSYREDSRKGIERTFPAWDHRSKAASQIYDTSTITWLTGFIQSVGLERAIRLLGDAGLPPEYDASHKKDEFKCKFGAECRRLRSLYNETEQPATNGMMGMMMGGAVAKQRNSAGARPKKAIRGRT